MQTLTSDQLDQLIFDNSLVASMDVDLVGKSLTIRCDRAYLDHADDPIEIRDVVLSLKGFSGIVARLYNDDEFETVEASDQAYFLAEVCELSSEGGKTTISGFSNQEGGWSDFTIEGGTLSAAHG